MLDSRIASFCCTSQVPERTPFAFTVLAAVLPPEEEVESPSHLSADPTDFLYCTAVRFIEGGRCLAYCLVSRHPFVEAFGQLLVMLHDGEEVLEDVGEAEVSIHDVPGGEGDAKPDRLRRVAHKLFNAVPQLRPETRRSRTEPSKAVEAALSDLNEDVGRAPVVSVDTKKSQCSSLASLHRSGSEEMCRGRARRGKLSLANFSYPPRSRQLRNLFQEDLRLRSTVLLEWAAADLFSRFTLQAILEIVVALLLEFRVVVVSQSPELASKLVLGLSSLLWPFSWQHLLLPICPAYLQEAIIDAPVPFISALPEVTPQVATASGTAPFTPRSVMGPAASRHGLVLCDADVGVVNLPPGSAPYLREDLPQLRMLRKDPRIHCRLSEDGGLSESEAKSVAMARVSSLQVALSELAEGLVEAGQEASLELGTSAWLQCMEVRLCESFQMPQSQFLKAFVNTETCLMFLALGS